MTISPNTRAAPVLPARISPRRRRARVTRTVVAVQVGTVVSFIALWHLGANQGWIDSFLYGSPAGIWRDLHRWTVEGTLLDATLITLYEAIAGFVIAVVLAVPAGILLARWSFGERVMRPFIDMANATPRFALAPVFILLFGLTSTMKVVLVISIVFFVMLINTMAGVRAIDPDFIRLARITGAGQFNFVARVLIPATGGYILAGLRLSVPYALSGAVVGEMLSGSSGLGYLVSEQAGLVNMSGVLAAVIVLALLGWILNSAVNLAVKQTPWARGVDARVGAAT